MEIMELRQVSYCYHTKKQLVCAVNQVSCQMKSGLFQVITGKSGSGKTTLLSLMAGLLKPEKGQILLDGQNLGNMDLDLYRRKYLGIVFQNYNLFPFMTVRENVMYPMLLNGINKEKASRLAEECLDKVEISSKQLKFLPASLSGGEQQRVAIARALSSGAEIILADEPTGNLDEENTERIVKLLLEIAHKENCMVITVTHDPQVELFADKVFRMQRGELIAEGEGK